MSDGARRAPLEITKSPDDFPDVGTDRYFLLKGAGVLENIPRPLKRKIPAQQQLLKKNRTSWAVEKKQVLSTMQLLFLMLKN